jgi:tartrate dehydrogenase/decarboxylase/D-malate dehydrogenase
MLDWLGENKAAAELMNAVEEVTERGIKTKDLGGQNTTEQVTQAIVDEIRSL